MIVPAPLMSQCFVFDLVAHLLNASQCGTTMIVYPFRLVGKKVFEPTPCLQAKQQSPATRGGYRGTEGYGASRIDEPALCRVYGYNLPRCATISQHPNC